jgi:hypothetical protein
MDDHHFGYIIKLKKEEALEHISPFSRFAFESKLNISQVEPIQRKAKKEDRQKRPKIKRLCYFQMKTKMKFEPDKDESEKQQSKKPTEDGERE